MDFKNFIGIDISKDTFDYALIKDGNLYNLISGKTTNTPSGLVMFEGFLKRTRHRHG